MSFPYLLLNFISNSLNMSIYLISNRATDDNDRFLNSGKERAQHSFRIAKCSLNETRKTADYVMVKDKVDQGYEYVLVDEADDKTDLNNLHGTAHMFYDLYQDMRDNQGAKGDVMFFIHGFSTDFEASLKDIYQLHERYIAPEHSSIKHLIYMSWPSVKSKVLTYWNDQQDALQTGAVLGRIFGKLHGFFTEIFEMKQANRCKHGIHLAAHSMGNQVLSAMLESIPKTRLFPLFDEVVLLQADVDYDILDEGEPFSRLETISNRTHIYTHRSDDALRVSRYTKNLKQRLGFKGPKKSTQLNDETFVVDTSRTKADKGEIGEMVADHSGYLHRKRVVEDVVEALKGTDEQSIKNRKRIKKHNHFLLKK